jgi:hypothetical protein
MHGETTSLSRFAKHTLPEGALVCVCRTPFRQEQHLCLLMEALRHLPPLVALLTQLMYGLRLLLEHLFPCGKPFPQDMHFQLCRSVSMVFLFCFTLCLNVLRPLGLGGKGSKLLPKDSCQFSTIDLPLPLVSSEVGDLAMVHHIIGAFAVQPIHNSKRF